MKKRDLLKEREKIVGKKVANDNQPTKENKWLNMVIHTGQINQKMSSGKAYFTCMEDLKGHPHFFWLPKSLVRVLGVNNKLAKVSLPTIKKDGSPFKLTEFVYLDEAERWTASEIEHSTEDISVAMKWQDEKWLEKNEEYVRAQAAKIIQSEHPELKKKVEESCMNARKAFFPQMPSAVERFQAEG